MSLTSTLKRGMYIKYKEEPYLIIEHLFTTQGRVSAFNKVKMKSLITGKVISENFKSNQKVEEIDVTMRTMQFLYIDGKGAYFMDPSNFEQISVSLNIIEGGSSYLHEEGKYVMVFYEDNVINVKLPPSIKLKVIETTDAVKGNTTSGATKLAKLETGLELQVPLFIKKEDEVIVNTQTGEYIEKVS